MIKNPCKGICVQHPNYKFCANKKGEGCHRSRLEINIWDKATDALREEILENCARKKELYAPLFASNTE